jgi:hypothetical protein
MPRISDSAFVDGVWPQIKQQVDTSMFALDTNKAGIRGALCLAADIAVSSFRTSNQAAPAEDWDEINLRAELSALRAELAEAERFIESLNTEFGTRIVDAVDLVDCAAESEAEAQAEAKRFDGEVIIRHTSDWELE